MNTWEVSGHDWAVEMLQRQVLTGSLRHAYLLTGPVGVGRRTLAVRLAQAINCASPLAPAVPCRMCRTCRQIESEQHPDLMVIRKPEDKKDIPVDKIRELGKFFSLKPYMSPYKIVIILNFEDANASSQNALLKTLEEAPSFGVILLTAGNMEQLLPTIASRCEILRMRPLRVESVNEFLRAQGVEADQANLLSHLSDGRPGYAMQLLDDHKALAFRSEKLDDLHRLMSAKLRERIHYSEKLVKDKDAFRQTLFIWLSYWRDVMLKASGAQIELTNSDRVEEIENLAYALDRVRAHAVTDGLEQAIDRLDRNVNSRLLAEVTLMDWPRVEITR
jgi:DNA polymerase-3 subunit delta'